MSKRDKSDEGIDYRAEGRDPGTEKKSPTDEGYDEAANTGASRFGVPSGKGGVFGTTGGGTFPEGIEIQEQIDDREQEEAEKARESRVGSPSKPSDEDLE